MSAGDLSVGSIFKILVEHQVNFLVVGGVNALLLGAPVMTFDLDVVHERTNDNIERLLAALAVLDAKYRQRQELRPNATHLVGIGPQLLATKHGPLDVLGTIGSGRGYAELVAYSQDVEAEPGLVVKMLTAEALLEEKLVMRRTKDLTSIAWLQEIIRRQG